MREVGGDCARHDIPYVLELLVYPFLGAANHTADYVESPGKRPGLVNDSMREFAKPMARCHSEKIFRIAPPSQPACATMVSACWRGSTSYHGKGCAMESALSGVHGYQAGR